MLNKFDNKQNPMGVPEGYFEQMKKNVMSTVTSEQTSKLPMKKKRTVLAWFMGIGAAAILAGVLFFSTQNIAYLTSGTVGDMQNISSDGSFVMNEIDDDDYYLFLQDLLDEADYEEYLLDDNN